MEYIIEMDIAINRRDSIDIISYVKEIVSVCRISKLEQVMSTCLENLPQETPINYIGELNKNDIMH